MEAQAVEFYLSNYIVNFCIQDVRDAYASIPQVAEATSSWTAVCLSKAASQKLGFVESWGSLMAAFDPVLSSGEHVGRP
jgi:hypothetical protein